MVCLNSVENLKNRICHFAHQNKGIVSIKKTNTAKVDPILSYLYVHHTCTCAYYKGENANKSIVRVKLIEWIF